LSQSYVQVNARYKGTKNNKGLNKPNVIKGPSILRLRVNEGRGALAGLPSHVRLDWRVQGSSTPSDTQYTSDQLH